MPIDTRDWWKEWWDRYRWGRGKQGFPAPKKVEHSQYYPRDDSKPPFRKILLGLLLAACAVATVYTGYLLFTHQTNQIVGAIVFAADIGVLIWNISVLRKHRVGTGIVISILVVIVLLGATVSAFAGVEPFSEAKAGVVAWFQK